MRVRVFESVCVCVRTCVCMYKYIYIDIHTYIYTHKTLYICLCTFIYTYIFHIEKCLQRIDAYDKGNNIKTRYLLIVRTKRIILSKIYHLTVLMVIHVVNRVVAVVLPLKSGFMVMWRDSAMVKSNLFG